MVTAPTVVTGLRGENSQFCQAWQCLTMFLMRPCNGVECAASGPKGHAGSRYSIGLASGWSSCEVMIYGRAQLPWVGGAVRSPRFRPNSRCRCERGFLREHGQSTLCDGSANFALVSLDVSKWVCRF